MGIAEITQSRGWQNVMKFVYGWGASVVLLGALFKILHLPGATIMLILGMGTEVIIFFLSAFEPLPEEHDWTRVYPELAGAGDEDEIELPEPKAKSSSGGQSLQKMDEMMDEAGLSPELFEKLSAGMQNLSQTTNNLSDLSDATVATKEYTDNVKTAASEVANVSQTYKESVETVKEATSKSAEAVTQATEDISYSVSSLSDTYQKSAQKVSGSSEELANSYSQLASKMDVDFTPLSDQNTQYADKMSELNKNLSALNAIFELQLQDSDVEKMVEDLNSSVTEAKNYHSQISQLSKKLEALNTVYGNMLTAMNVHMKE